MLQSWFLPERFLRSLSDGNPLRKEVTARRKGRLLIRQHIGHVGLDKMVVREMVVHEYGGGKSRFLSRKVRHVEVAGCDAMTSQGAI